MFEMLSSSGETYFVILLKKWAGQSHFKYLLFLEGVAKCFSVIFSSGLHFRQEIFLEHPLRPRPADFSELCCVGLPRKIRTISK